MPYGVLAAGVVGLVALCFVADLRGRWFMLIPLPAVFFLGYFA